MGVQFSLRTELTNDRSGRILPRAAEPWGSPQWWLVT